MKDKGEEGRKAGRRQREWDVKIAIKVRGRGVKEKRGGRKN